MNDGWLMFSSDFNNMEAFFVYYDWLYDGAFGTGDFQYGYLEGYDYDIVDGEVVFDSTLFDPPVTDPFMPGKSTVLKNSPRLIPCSLIWISKKERLRRAALRSGQPLRLNRPLIRRKAM